MDLCLVSLIQKLKKAFYKMISYQIFEDGIIILWNPE